MDGALQTQGTEITVCCGLACDASANLGDLWLSPRANLQMIKVSEKSGISVRTKLYFHSNDTDIMLDLVVDAVARCFQHQIYSQIFKRYL